MGRRKAKAEAQEKPIHGITVTTYDDFHADMKAFAGGNYRFLMIVGPGGTGKTEAAKRFIPNAVFISGEPTPFDLFKTVCDCATVQDANGENPPLVFNDIAQSFWSNNRTVALMKQLTETKEWRELQWNSNAASREGYPKKVLVNSPVLLLANKWKSLDPNVRALETRAEVTIDFEPTAYEVHKQVAADGWFDDQDVYDFIYDNLAIIPEASFRWYVAGRSLRKARPDKWGSRLLEMMLGDIQMKEVASLLQSKTIRTNAERAQAFAKTFSSTERQFYRLKAEFKNWSRASEVGDNFTLA